MVVAAEVADEEHTHTEFLTLDDSYHNQTAGHCQ